MPKFSERSKKNLSFCDVRLQELFNEVIHHFDCIIICGHRNKAEQTEAYNNGKSKLRYPKSRHNSLPSMAVDVSPYPVEWGNIHRFIFFAGFVLGTAKQRGIPLRWGGDWDQDTQTKDNKFDDLVHFEIKE